VKTPELIALLLAAPLDVRLALLDADPKGAGWFVTDYGFDILNVQSNYMTGGLASSVNDGAAWLPCNPLAIVRHAIALRGSGRPAATFYDEIGWRFDIMEERRGEDLPVCSEDNVCEYTAAVRLLAKVVGHG
jgi:hypothetical protein